MRVGSVEGSDGVVEQRRTTVVEQDGGSAGDRRRARDREAAARAASATPSAARWLVVEAGSDGTEVFPVDVVADLLGLDERTRLRGRGDAQLRRFAARLDGLVSAGAVTPSGRSLLEVLVVDPSAREALEPSFDLDALFGDGPPRSSAHDRSVRLAEAVVERAAAHRGGRVDLHAEVAPIGTARHPAADELEALVRVATERHLAVGGPDPAIVTAAAGWVGVSPVELFLAAGAGVLQGVARDVAGAVLVRWLTAVVEDAGDPWWLGLTSRLPVDAVTLLQGAAAQAGSDHPDVAGPVLVDRIAGAYPLGT
ncbi:hypothetical protein FTX61_09465 [Nitriliruptoraceae bacterium ZYF776]|nr:hypothetical protein [Profundirhabdus halotolerans]